MPNKDSFTFSDKLKKSKSLPLSKRIPSKVGGDGKAKRTLIQRAQRDLPFIIVAAAALLLLPILSRNSGTDDLGTETPMDFVAPDTSGSDSGGLGQEIAPSSGFKNPLDWIVSRSGKDTEGNRDSLDAGEEDGGYDATTPPYTSSVEGSGDRATEKYAPAAKGAVRNALVRKATEVAALRNSKTVASGASTGVSRSLATGSAASGGGAGAPRVGVRPVALQPMASAGKGGRSETGEGLYAEAARSLAAMNRGGSKQALFDAQLKNVDGTPLGSIGGGPNFGAGAGKLGAGGAPSNNVGYKPYLPWWWDFEKMKAQEMWKLWNFNFQKALSDNIIKVGTGLALCLTTGSAEGSVNKFLGEDNGSDDMICVDSSGNKKYISQNDYLERLKVSGGKEGSGAAISSKDWDTLCKENGGQPKFDPAGGRKNMLDVRLRCLGFKYKNSGLYKWLSGAEYEVDCSGAGADPMSFEIKTDKKRHLGHYVLAKNINAKDTEEKGERIIYVGDGGKLDSSELKSTLKSLNVNGAQYVVTSIRGFKGNSGAGMSSNDVPRAKAKLEKLKSYQNVDIAENYSTPNDPSGQQGYKFALADAESKLDKARSAVAADGSDANASYESRFTMFKNAVASSNKPDGKPIYDAYADSKFTVLKYCDVNKDFQTTEVKDPKLNPTENGISARDTKTFVSCGPLSPSAVSLMSGPKYLFSSNITNPGKNVYAIFVEETQGTKGYIVKKVHKFDSDANYKDENGNYFMDVQVGLATKGMDVKQEVAAPGTGKVFWITTNSKSAPKVKPYLNESDKKEEGVNYFTDGNISIDQLVDVYGGSKHAVCEYRWGCTSSLCPGKKEANTKEYCRKPLGAGSYALFDAIPADPKTSVATGTQIIEINGGVTKDKYDKYFLGKEWFDKMDGAPATFCTDCFKDNVPECVNVCVDKQGNVSVKSDDGTFKPLDPVVKKDAVKGLTTENCPDCKPEPEVTGTPAPKSCEFSFYDTFVRGSFNKFNNQNSNTISEAVSTLSKCISNKDVESHIVLYVTGFTDNAGESEKVEKECLGGYCLSPEDPDEGAKIKSNPKNFSLSEDRAKYIAETIAIGLSERHKRDGLQINLKFAKNPSADKVFAGSYLFKSTVYGPANNPKKILDFIIGGVGSTHAKYAASDSDKAKLDRKVLITVTPIFVGKEIK